MSGALVVISVVAVVGLVVYIIKAIFGKGTRTYIINLPKTEKDNA